MRVAVDNQGTGTACSEEDVVEDVASHVGAGRSREDRFAGEEEALGTRGVPDSRVDIAEDIGLEELGLMVVLQ